MRAVVQRVASASVSVGGDMISEIGKGLMILVGIASDDTEKDVDYISSKCCNLRIFDDENGVMNLSAQETGGEILLVSQFTLMGDARKGRRPSYIKAAGPEIAVPLYEKLASMLKDCGFTVKTGIFGADMQVALVNDGPVTILLDSRKTF